MAPEIVDPKCRQRGYTKCVDWWSLGVLVFELTAGQTPFHDEDLEGEEFDFFELLRIQKAGIPPGALPPDTPAQGMRIIEQLLTVDPATRLGAGGAEEIRSHEWFARAYFDFERLRKLQLKVPFSPKAAVPRNPAPEMWTKKGEPVEVLVTQEDDTILENGGDRYNKDLSVVQALGLARGMSLRDYKDGKDDWCQGFCCPTPRGEDDVMPCSFKGHFNSEEQKGWTSYRCHPDLFSRYDKEAGGGEIFKQFKLPPSVMVRNKLKKKQAQGNARKGSMFMAAESLMKRWTGKK